MVCSSHLDINKNKKYSAFKPIKLYLKPRVYNDIKKSIGKKSIGHPWKKAGNQIITLKTGKGKEASIDPAFSMETLGN